MTPILYKENETDFYHKGIGSLEELIFVEVTEEGNGDFGLVLEYPADGRYFNAIKEFMFIKAKPNAEDEPHIFRIYEIEKDSVGLSVNIYATSKTIADLQGNMVRKVVVNKENPQQAMNKMKNNLVYPTTYDFYSDITTTSSTEWIRRNPLNCIAGEEGSLLQYWGGEIKRGNQIISLLKRRGKDNVATIRYGKNLNGLVANFSVKGMVTRILPHFTYTPEGKDDPVTIEGSFVDSQYINNYPIPFIREVDFSSDDDVKDLASLNRKAKQYFIENTGIDKPSVTMEIQIEDLFSTTEYSEKFKKLEKILLFDTVTVYHKKFDISITAKVNKLVYDPYREKNVSLEVGSTRNTMLDDIKKDTQYQLNEVKKELNYVSLSADGKSRINYGSATPSIANKNDLWFKPNGEFTIMYRFDGVYWQPIIDTEDLDKVAQEVTAAIAQADADRIATEQKFDQAVTDAKAYTEQKANEFKNQMEIVKADLADTVIKANDAVAKANQSIADVGFMQIDLNTTKQNAIDALTKAQTATDNLNTLSFNVDELTKTVGFKAEKTTVDAVTKQVNQHELSIAANAKEIDLRMTSTQVDSLVSAKGYVNQAQLTATSDKWNLALTQVSSDLEGLEIGGRNLLLDSAKTVSGSGYSLTSYNWADIKDIVGGKEYTVTVIGELVTGQTGWYLNTYADNGTTFPGMVTLTNSNKVSENMWVGTFKMPNVSNPTGKTTLYSQPFSNGKTATVYKVKVEKGTKATDWTPAPEDMVTLEQFTTIDATVKGLQTTVGNKADKTEMTQLANQWTQTTALANGHTGQISNLGEQIDLRVVKGDVIGQITVEAGRTLIRNGQLVLDANTYIMGTTFANDIKAKSVDAVVADIATVRTKMLTADVITSTMLKSDTAMVNKIFATDANVSILTTKNAFINSVKAIDIAADRITAGTLNAAKVTIINLDASRITTGTLSGANYALNLNTGSETFRNPSNGNTLLIQQDKFYFDTNSASHYLIPDNEGFALVPGTGNTGNNRNAGIRLKSTNFNYLDLGLGSDGGFQYRIGGYANNFAFMSKNSGDFVFSHTAIGDSNVGSHMWKLQDGNYGTLNYGKTNLVINGYDGSVVPKVSVFNPANGQLATFDTQFLNLTGPTGTIELSQAGGSFKITHGVNRNWVFAQGNNGTVTYGTTMIALNGHNNASARLSVYGSNGTTYGYMSAANFDVQSERKHKSSITDLGGALSILSTMKIHQYIKNGISEIGIITDEAPLQLLSDNNTKVSLYDFISLTAKGTQELTDISYLHERKLNNHDTRLAELEKENKLLKQKIEKLESAA